MEIWSLWTHTLEALLAHLASDFGLSQGLAIVVTTLIARLALMPVSLASAYRMQINKETLARLKPQVEALRAECAGDAKALSARTMALYRENGVVLMDRWTLANLATQSGFGIGFFQALGRIGFGSAFQWIETLSKPDVWLTVLVTALMLLGMALMPGALNDSSSVLMLAVPVVIAVLAVAALPASVGLYWAALNAVTVLQSLAVRGLMARRARRLSGVGLA